MAKKFPFKKKNKINKELQNLTNNILQEKTKNEPDQIKIEKCQASFDNIETYKMHGTIIRGKEMSIINEKIPDKYFYLRGQKNKQKNK